MLFNLPSDLIVEITNCWLQVSLLSLLDSALCNMIERPNFKKLVFKYGKVDTSTQNIKNKLTLNWIKLRNVDLTNVLWCRRFADFLIQTILTKKAKEYNLSLTAFIVQKCSGNLK